MRHVLHTSGPVGGTVWKKFGWYHGLARRSISLGVGLRVKSLAYFQFIVSALFMEFKM